MDKIKRTSLIYLFLFLHCSCYGLTPHGDEEPSQNGSENDIPQPTTTEGKSTTTTTATSTTSSTTTTKAPTIPPKSKSHRQLLRQYLLQHYDKMVHPVNDSSDTVTVGIGLAIIHFDVDEMKSVFSVDAWMRLGWTDHKLSWNPKDFGNLSKIHFGVNEIWKPDVLLYNSADTAKIDPYGNTHYVVENNGQVLWVPPAHLEAFCKLNLRYWPFDIQKCKLKFGSWTSNGNEIDVQLYNNQSEAEHLNFYTNNREWNMSTTQGTRNAIKYICCPEPYPDVTYDFTIARIAPAYKSTIILPCLVIMLMTVCCFLLPPYAGEKIFINCIAFLAAVMYLIYFAFTIPFHETEVPIIVMFYSNTTALIGISLLLNVCCISMCRERKFSSPPKCLRDLFTGSVGKFLCLGHYYHQVSSTHQRLVLELSDMAESDQQDTNAGVGNSNLSAEDGINFNSATDSANGSDFDPVERVVGAARAKEGSGVMKEWILVAAGLERFFFIIYTLAFAVVTSVYV